MTSCRLAHRERLFEIPINVLHLVSRYMRSAYIVVYNVASNQLLTYCGIRCFTIIFLFLNC